MYDIRKSNVAFVSSVLSTVLNITVKLYAVHWKVRTRTSENTSSLYLTVHGEIVSKCNESLSSKIQMQSVAVPDLNEIQA